MSFDRDHIKSIQQTVDQINEKFSREDLVDFFKVASYDGKKLVIWASSDFTTHHSFEIIFEKVFFFKGDFEWSRNEEIPLITIAEILNDPAGGRAKFILESDGYYYSNHNHKVEIEAADISYDTTVVLYFHKDVLAPGERVAEWVKRKD
jgi:ABC-type molybdate transport system substrate-binding protein